MTVTGCWKRPGRTRLEGSTWYTLEIYPQVYWRPIAEWLLTKIHTRVLEQVKGESEGPDISSNLSLALTVTGYR